MERLVSERLNRSIQISWRNRRNERDNGIDFESNEVRTATATSRGSISRLKTSATQHSGKHIFRNYVHVPSLNV